MKRLIAVLILAAGGLFAQQPVTVPGWAGGTLGAMANYGTSPGAVLVPGVNAFVTNTVAVTGTFWQSTQPVTFGPVTTSGGAATLKHFTTAAAANAKASAGNVYALILNNGGSSVCYLQLFNTAGTPTAGTSVIDSVMVQAGVTVVVPLGGLALSNYATGIGFAGATTDSGATTTGCTTTLTGSLYYD
jgi:hypothetical protein